MPSAILRGFLSMCLSHAFWPIVLKEVWMPHQSIHGGR